MTKEATERAFIAMPFLENHKAHREKIRGLSKESNKNLLTAHQLIFSALISYQDRVQGLKFAAASEDAIGKMFLVAQFVQGIEHTESAISEGLYPQAANLLKQEFETIAAIQEFSEGTRIDGKTPRFRGRLKEFGRRYSELNDLAHPSRSEIVAMLSGFEEAERHGPTTIPQFKSDLYQMLYGNQAFLMVILLSQMRELFCEVFGVDWDDTETRLVASAAGLLLEEGIFKSTPS